MTAPRGIAHGRRRMRVGKSRYLSPYIPLPIAGNPQYLSQTDPPVSPRRYESLQRTTNQSTSTVITGQSPRCTTQLVTSCSLLDRGLYTMQMVDRSLRPEVIPSHHITSRMRAGLARLMAARLQEHRMAARLQEHPMATQIQEHPMAVRLQEYLMAACPPQYEFLPRSMSRIRVYLALPHTESPPLRPLDRDQDTMSTACQWPRLLSPCMGTSASRSPRSMYVPFLAGR